jgi:hypothetical protein
MKFSADCPFFAAAERISSVDERISSVDERISSVDEIVFAGIL